MGYWVRAPRISTRATQRVPVDQSRRQRFKKKFPLHAPNGPPLEICTGWLREFAVYTFRTNKRDHRWFRVRFPGCSEERHFHLPDLDERRRIPAKPSYRCCSEYPHELVAINYYGPDQFAVKGRYGGRSEYILEQTENANIVILLRIRVSEHQTGVERVRKKEEGENFASPW